MRREEAPAGRDDGGFPLPDSSRSSHLSRHGPYSVKLMGFPSDSDALVLEKAKHVEVEDEDVKFLVHAVRDPRKPHTLGES